MRDNAKEMDAPYQGQGCKRRDDELCRAYEIAQSNYRTHLAQLKKLIPPFEAFYNSQSDEQKRLPIRYSGQGNMRKKHKENNR